MGPQVVVCHQRPIVSEGIARSLERSLDATVDTAVGLDQAITKARLGKPDLVVCGDFGWPDHVSLAQAIGRFRETVAGVPVLVLGRTSGHRAAATTLAAGAVGYVCVNQTPQQLAFAAAAAISGKQISPSSTFDPLLLTAREFDVLQLLDAGLTDKEIAAKLGVAVATIKTHARAIYLKLGATSRTHALSRARASDLL